MEQAFELKNGVQFIIRSPAENDLDKSFAFFQGLSPEDRQYLRIDVSKRKIVEQRLQNYGEKNTKRLVAIVGDEIVADGAIELRTHGWEQHIGELRLLVSSSYKGKGIGGKMAEKLYMIAMKEKVEEIVVKLMAPHKGALAIFEKIGFKKDAVIKNYIKDVNGVKQDLILMRCDIDALWKNLEDHYKETERYIEDL